jgi:HEAT repeat protein
VRLCEQAVKRDPGCRGKIAIARTLHDLDRWDDHVLARGVAYVQREPAFGGAVDTAGELRGICGLIYAQSGRADALDVIGQLLADPERIARVAAAQALGDIGRPGASALLRYKALVGDAEPEVVAACLEALLRLSGQDALGFVGEFLGPHDERAEIAALALGGSRLPGAFAVLDAWRGACFARQRHSVAYLALALLRDDRATATLVDIVRTGEPGDAVAAARALSTFAADPAVAALIEAAARDQRDAGARAEIAKLAR